MRPLHRVWIYKTEHTRVMKWVEKKKQDNPFFRAAPNRKDNFPYYLEQYLMEVEQCKKSGKRCPLLAPSVEGEPSS